MATQNKKDTIRDTSGRAIYLKVTLALISLLAVFLVTQRSASTQEKSRGQARKETMQIEMIDGVEVVAGEAIVRFDAARRDLQTYVNHAVSMSRASEHRPLGPAGLDMFHFRSKEMSAKALVEMLSRLPGVKYAEPNYVYRAQQTPDDPSFGSLWGLNNTGQNGGRVDADIDAVEAWGVSTGSASIVVGVIDTGIDYNHPDLAENIWSAPADFSVTIGGQTINCPAGSHGFNVITGSCDPLDDNGHGTHTSGTIGARGNNSLGVAGVNWRTSIMGLKFLDSAGAGSVNGAIACIDFAIQAKNAFAGSNGANIRILSNSYGGGPFSTAMYDAIERANNADMLFVAAAGNASANNDSTPAYPASYDIENVLAVAATDRHDELSDFSNYGATTVDLGAPGSDIESTWLRGTYNTINGTSMATPHVSGAAALVLSRCPSLNTAALKANLMNNVDPIDALAGITVTGGRLNVNNAIRACSPNIVPVASCHDVTVEAGSDCRADASIDNGSSDPDGDSITITQSPSGPYPVGSTTVTLTVTDSSGASSSCAAVVTVVDRAAPTITLFGANPMTVECPYGFIDPGATATDDCAGSLPVTTSGSVNTAVPGAYTITYRASDGRGNTATRTRAVNVVDTTAPTLMLNPNISRWPPSHKYHTLTVSQMVASVSDGCNSSLGINDVVIEKVASDEPDDAAGDADGITTADIVIAADCRSVQLRSERDETKNGRVYTIMLRLRDPSGNVTRREFNVSIPIGQDGVAAVKDSPALTVTGGCP